METDSQETLFHQDPQGNLSLQVEEGNCTVTFYLWNSADEEVTSHKGVIRFFHGWACEYVSMELYPYPDRKEPDAPAAFIFKISPSNWLNEKVEKRSQLYPDWLSWDKKNYVHYLITGHDNYVQVIATGYEIDFVVNPGTELP